MWCEFGNGRDYSAQFKRFCHMERGYTTKELTTLIVKQDGSVDFGKTNNLGEIPDLRAALSGMPILKEGEEVSLSKDILPEGYDISPLYETWHGFLTYQGPNLLYIGAYTGYGNYVSKDNAIKSTTVMANLLKQLGCSNTVIKLDGGGSYLLKIGGKKWPVQGEPED